MRASQGFKDWGPVRFGVAVIALTMLCFAAWASLAPLSGAIVATGFVKTEGNRKALQHPEGGVIRALHVKDGDLVRTGQPLIELEGLVQDASLRMMREMLLSETLRRDRLDAEQQMAKAFQPSAELRSAYPDSTLAPAYERELAIYRSRRQNLTEQLATLSDQLRVITEEQRAVRTQISAVSDSMRLANAEVEMNQSLHEQQFVSRAKLLTAERTVTDYRSRHGELEATLAQSLQRENDVKLRMAASQNTYQQQASEEFKDSSNRLSELRERLRPLEVQILRQTLTAPVQGRVVGLRYHGVDQVVGPRDVIMEIVPQGGGLIVEALVGVDSIRELHVGQTADLRFTAFSARTTPLVKGELIYISADALTNAQGQPHYQVHIRADDASLQSAGIAALQPGMAAETFIVTRPRTALEFMLSPVTDALRKSMRER